MALLGQASGGWTESSSALRILHVGIRNTIATLTADAFRQTNPPIGTAILPANTISTSPGLLTEVFGILSGSVAFTRPDAGSPFVGGPISVTGGSTASAYTLRCVRPVGCFINNAAGNPYENLPASASGVGPYVSAMGTYGSRLFETQALQAAGALAQGDALTYLAGQTLVASVNGYLMPGSQDNAGAFSSLDIAGAALEVDNGAAASTVIGILKMVPDSVQTEIVFDQRI